MAIDTVFGFLFAKLFFHFFVSDRNFGERELKVADLRTHRLKNVVLDFDMMTAFLLFLHQTRFNSI